MRIRGFILGIVLMLGGMGNSMLIAQTENPVIIRAGSASGFQGDQVCVDITVEDFIQMQSLQFSIHFDPTVLTPICPPSVLSLAGLAPTNFACNEIDEGHISMLWLDPDNGTFCGVTLPDSTSIFTLCFDLTGDPGTESPFYVAGDQLPIEYTQIPDCTKLDSFVTKTSTTISIGTITIECGNLAVFEGKCDSAPGQGNGSLNFYACGGTPPYNYTINGAGLTGTVNNQRETVFIQNLTPGIYSVTIQDAGGNTVTSSAITIAESPAIDVTLNLTPPTCVDRENGAIEILNISGGTGPYITQWDNFNFNNNRYARLGNGTYGLTVTDAAGCQQEETIELLRDTIKVEATLINDATCSGSTDGIVQLVASGGNPYSGGRYSYNFSAPIDTFVRSDLAEGWFVYRVSDSSSPTCRTEFDSIFVGIQTMIDTDVTVSDISCFGEVDGGVTVNGLGATDFRFSVFDITGMNIGATCRSNRTTIDCFALPAGTYTAVTTEISRGCIREDIIVITEPDSLQVAATFTDPTCAGADGVIDITATGGTTLSDYTITWSDGGAGTVRNDLNGGLYDITVADDNGCDTVFQISLNAPVDISITPTIVQPITCNDGITGILEVDVATVGNFAYRWLQGTDTVAFTKQATNLGPGLYEVLVIDTMLDCQTRDTISLSNPEGISITANYTLPLCPFPEFTTGSIGISASGGSGNYSYEWSDGSTNSVLASLAAGQYQVTVIDDLGCTLDTLLTLNNPDSIDVQITDVFGVDCFGEANGSAIAIASGGTVNDGRYNFFWSSGAQDTDTDVAASFANNLEAGRQYLIVTDATCPADTVFFDVPDSTPIGLDRSNTVVTDPACFGECTGSIEAFAQGGNDIFYDFQWMFDGSTGSTLSGICRDTYYVMITDANGCTSLDSVILSEPDSLSVTIDPQTTLDPNCFNAGAAQIGLSASGGTPEYTYVWTDDVSTGPIASGLSDGNYFVTVTDANGCTASTSYILASAPPIQAIIPQPEPPLCFGGQTCVEVSSVTGGSGENYTFTVNRGIRFPVDSCIQVFAGPYTVTVFDGDGCSQEYTVDVTQPAPISVELGPDQTVALGESTGPVNLDIDAVFNITEIAWNPLDSLNCLTSNCQVVRFSPEESTLYTVQVTDENGCTARDDIFIEVSKRRNVFAANVFSPNQDGRNDYFQLTTGAGVEAVQKFVVFDRWGQPVWIQENYLPNPDGSDGWDGTIGGQNAIPGVYAYVAEVRFIDDQVITFKGSITLLR